MYSNNMGFLHFTTNPIFVFRRYFGIDIDYNPEQLTLFYICNGEVRFHLQGRD